MSRAQLTEDDAREQFNNIYKKFNFNLQKYFIPHVYRCSKKFPEDDDAYETCIEEAKTKIDAIM